ncbi:hypothetical protein LTR97_001498 [Elasticomyces elasticus]|uniref:Uncharacterized protein n=1 Tax=Elasticomyces elasticus TaxID=574655 RepID=A0AAN8A601_9PEZI|nr:hypothetical protein LTR97_001498 [Elasticomyces elasticus]
MSENAMKTPESQDVFAHNASGPAEKTVLPLVAAQKKSVMKASPGLNRKRKLDVAAPSSSAGPDLTVKSRSKRQKSIGDVMEVSKGSQKDASGALAVIPKKPPGKKRGRQLKSLGPEVEEYKLRRQGALPLSEPVQHTDEASFNAFRDQSVKLEKERKLDRDRVAARLRTQKKTQLAEEKALMLQSKESKSGSESGQVEATRAVAIIESAEAGEQSLRDDTAETHLSEEEAEVGDEMAKEGLRKDMETTKFKIGTNEFTESMKNLNRGHAKIYPALLGHVHSDVGDRPTGGSASRHRLEPSAKVREQVVYNSIYDFPDRKELVRNIGDRILWNNRVGDQLMSHSVSPVFLLQHAMGRYKEKRKIAKSKSKAVVSKSGATRPTSVSKKKAFGSKKKVNEIERSGVTISFIQTRTARDEEGEQANFHYVPDLISDNGVLQWEGWPQMWSDHIRAPWYDHEWLTHGPVDLDISALRQVPIEDLLTHGLQKFYPELFDDDHQAGAIGLYNGSTHLRYKSFRHSVCRAFTLEELDKAAELTRLFDPRATNPDDEQGRAHENLDGLPINLHIFLLFCSLRRRPADDALFAGYIQNYFEAPDAESIVDMGMKSIPNNLPEVMQYMARLREACVALDIPGPKHLGTILVDDNYSFDGVWAGDVEKLMPKEKPTGPKIVLVKGKKERLADAAKAKQIASAAANATVQHGSNVEGLKGAATLKHVTDGRNSDEEEAFIKRTMAASDEAGAASNFVVEELAVI